VLNSSNSDDVLMRNNWNWPLSQELFTRKAEKLKR